MAADVSTAELKEAYRRAELWRYGISFTQAVSHESTLRSMCHQVAFHRDLAAHREQRQRNLPLGHARAKTHCPGTYASHIAEAEAA